MYMSHEVCSSYELCICHELCISHELCIVSCAERVRVARVLGGCCKCACVTYACMYICALVTNFISHELSICIVKYVCVSQIMDHISIGRVTASKWCGQLSV